MVKSGETERFNKALDYARMKYKGLYREVNHFSYIFHPHNVVSLLRQCGYNEFLGNEDLLISALLHDVLEETDMELSEIENLFGENVAKIVSELTHPEGLSKNDWSEQFKAFSKEAKIIKIADRIDNLKDMETWSFPEERVSQYREQSKIILRTCGAVDKSLYSKLFNLVYYRIIPSASDGIILF